MDNEVTEANQPGSPTGRRRVLRAGLGGVAVSLLPFLHGRASATTPPSSGDEPVTGAAVTTTTAPTKRPTADDIPLLAFAESVELAAVKLYDVALRSLSDLDSVTRNVLLTIRENHLSYANSLSGFLGRQATGVVADDVVSDHEAAFSGALDDVLEAAGELENSLVSTHLDVLGQLEGIDGSALVASLVVTEGRHGTVLASLGGATDLDDLLVNDEADALTPAEG